jgi:DNA primase
MRDPWKGSRQVPPRHAYTEIATRGHDARAARRIDAPRLLACVVRRCAVSEDRDALKQRIKEANDIVDVVGGYINLRRAGPTFKALCPFHDDTRPSFDVDPRRQRYRCWSCGKHGDVFTFVQEREKVDFREALELLARRAGISLEKIQKNTQGPSRAGMLDVMKWAAEQFQHCLLDHADADVARKYLGERKLTGESVRKFGLGYAPDSWEWLVQQAANSGKSADLLETVGLIAKRNEGRGYYDRFRDRVIFPIRDIMGRVVGFGGRVLPNTANAEKGPKYYNSAETPLFSKSDLVYGIDQARQPASKAGYLAIVEGYTDVMMAHQNGVGQVCATMGTALNARHIKTIRHVASRVVLVFDADAGGEGGVDRALDVFVTNDLDLRIATLPEGLDPCDLFVKFGAEEGRRIFLDAVEQKAMDVLDYKLDRVWKKYGDGGLEGKRQGAEEMLAILAKSPQDRSVKMELMINRIAQRLTIKEETLWARVREMKRSAPGPRMGAANPGTSPPDPAPRQEENVGPAPIHERELVELLLAEPALIANAMIEVPLAELEHPRSKKVIEALYRLHASGQPADLDHLRELLDNEDLWHKLHLLQERGESYPDRPLMLKKIVERFCECRLKRRKQALTRQLQEAPDTATRMAILKQLRDLTQNENQAPGDKDDAA